MRKIFLVMIFAAMTVLSAPVLKAEAYGADADQDMPCDMCDGMGMHGGMGMMGGMDEMPMMGGGMGHGMMGGRGHDMMGLRSLRMLDLTPDQKSKINKIHDDLRKQDWTILGKIMDERVKLRDLYEADTLDAKKIDAVYDTIFGLRRQMITAQINAINNVRQVLTKEQRDRLKQLSTGVTGSMGMEPMHRGMSNP